MSEYTREKAKMFLIKLAMLALVIRLSISTAYYNIFISILKTPLYAFDGEAYSIMGWYVTLVLKGIRAFPFPQAFIPNDYSIVGGLYGTIVKFAGDLPPLYRYGVSLYSYIIGAFYYIFGYAPILLRFFNGIIGMASAFIVYLMARKNFNENTARIAFVFLLFLPSFVLYSASLQRDTIVNFLVIFVVYQIFSIRRRLRTNVNILHLAAALMGLSFLYFLRIHAALVILAFIFLYAYLNLASRFRYIAATFTASLLFIPQTRDFLFAFLKSKVTLMLNGHLYLSYLGGYVYRLLPDAYYKPDLILASKNIEWIPLGDCARAYLNGIAAFILQPLPLYFYKPYHWLALPYAVFWYLILLFALVGVYEALKNVTMTRIGLIFLLFMFTSAIGLLEANVEGLIRHRDMITPIYIIFAAYGVEVIRKR